MIDISNLNKAAVLAALFNNSKQQGMGFLHGHQPEMSLSDAEQELIDHCGTRFDYLHGKVMKVDVGGETLDPRLYDRDNGEGAALRALSGLLALSEAVGDLG